MVAMDEDAFKEDVARARPDLEVIAHELLEIETSLYSRRFRAHLAVAQAHLDLALEALDEAEELRTHRTLSHTNQAPEPPG